MMRINACGILNGPTCETNTDTTLSYTEKYLSLSFFWNFDNISLSKIPGRTPKPLLSSLPENIMLHRNIHTQQRKQEIRTSIG